MDPEASSTVAGTSSASASYKFDCDLRTHFQRRESQHGSWNLHRSNRLIHLLESRDIRDLGNNRAGAILPKESDQRLARDRILRIRSSGTGATRSAALVSGEANEDISDRSH